MSVSSARAAAPIAMRSSDTGQMTMFTPDVAQLVDGEQVGLAELGHVGEDRHVDGGAHRLELVERPHRLEEDRVGPGIHERLRAIDRGVQSLDRRGCRCAP